MGEDAVIPWRYRRDDSFPYCDTLPKGVEAGDLVELEGYYGDRRTDLAKNIYWANQTGLDAEHNIKRYRVVARFRVKELT